MARVAAQSDCDAAAEATSLRTVRAVRDTAGADHGHTNSVKTRRRSCNLWNQASSGQNTAGDCMSSSERVGCGNARHRRERAFAEHCRDQRDHVVSCAMRSRLSNPAEVGEARSRTSQMSICLQLRVPSLILGVAISLLLAPSVTAEGNLGSRYPLWGAGSNRNGALNSQINVGVTVPNNIPSQVLNFSDVGQGNEVISLAVGNTHVIAQSVSESSGGCDQVPASTVPRKTWSWGVNTYGQLGRKEGVGSDQAVESGLLARSYFPKRKLGNELSADEGTIIGFSKWNAITKRADFQNVTVTSGVKGLHGLEQEINSRIGEHVISLTTDPISEKAVVAVVKAGYQISFYGGKPIAEALGFLQPFLCPSNGVLNEISAARGNNLFTWSHHEGTIRIRQSDGNNLFRFRTWDSIMGQVSGLYELDIPDQDYTPYELSQALNTQVSALGFPSDLFNIGPQNLAIPGTPTLTWKYAGYVFDFAQSLDMSTDKPLLGFASTHPSSDLFAGDLPNEVSFNSRTNLFHYRYTDASFGWVMQNYTVDIDSGIHSIDAVLSQIEAKMNLNGHSNVLKLYTDSDSRVVLEIAKSGFQILLNKENTIGKYLGFDSVVIPCDPSDSGCPLASADVTCVNYGGCVTAAVSIQARADSSRPFMTRTSVASGSCSSGFICACDAESSANTPICYDTSSSQMSNASVSDGGCSCAAQNSFVNETALQSWGGFKRYSVRFADDEYTLNSLNQALLSHPDVPLRFRVAVFVVFEARRSDGVATVVIQMANVQVNFDQSTITSLLGFDSVSTRFTEPFEFYEQDGARPSTLITEREEKIAAETGEWIIQVAVGTDHTLVQTLNVDTGKKRLWAFGSNRFGQLGFAEGNGTDTAFEVPRLIPSVGSFYPTNARAVYAGGDHSAVVDVTGKLWMFGRNTDGQLGVDLGGAEWTAEPVLLSRSAFGNATDLSLAMGRTHTLVSGFINGNETALFSFGNSDNGKLGRSGDASVPGAVDFTLGIAQMCAGGEHSLLVTTDGRMWGTGLNEDGQLGVGGLQSQTDVISRFMLVGSSFSGAGFVWADPFQGSKVTSIACGQQHSAALTRDGSIWTFGSNSEGQLMNNVNTDLGNPNPFPARVDDSLFLFNTEVASAEATACSLGGGDFSTFVQTKRTFCLVGEFSVDGLQPCLFCPAGKYTPYNQSTTCIDCEIGSFTSQVGRSACDPCPKDTFANTTGQDQCIPCPANLPGTIGTGAFSEDNCTQLCQPGYFSDEGVPPCDPCPAGSFASERQATGCLPCEIGTYQPGNGSAACIPCPGANSTADVGANSSAACLEVCKAGESGVNGLAECTACGLGTFSGSPRSPSCSPCPEDTFANSTGQTACFACPAGFGTAGGGKDTIAACEKECAAGQYSSNFGLEPCLPCPAGTYTADEGSVVCLPCDPGFFSGVASTSCTPCPTGQYSAESASPNCTVCEMGKFQDQTNETSCDACEHSSFANSTGLSACIECAEGLFTKGEGSTRADECVQLCDVGTASDSGLKPEGDFPCAPCPDGQEPFNSTATVAVDAAVGVFGGRGCRDCEPGFFARSGFGVCMPCPSGTFSNTSQTSNCTDCLVGQFSNQNATVCGTCAPGSFASVPGTGNCSLCDRGSYQNASGQSICELCAPGSYAPRFGTVVGCQACPEGKFSASAGASFCEACAPGFFSGVRAQSCTPCPAGTFANASGTYVCKDCAAGTFSAAENSTTCLQCSPGEAAVARSSSCDTCVQGTYSDGTLATCTACPGPGPPSFSDEHSTTSTGSTVIWDCKEICPEGFYGTDGLSDATYQDCQRCPAGNFSSSPRSSSCDPCPVGAFSANEGATACTLCAGGSKVNADNTGCEPCDPGSFADQEGATECDPCAPGYFAPDPGRPFCLPCALGFYAESFGTIMCDECPFGTSTPNAASNSSSNCDQDCEPGKANPDSNGIERAGSPCEECAPGFYAPFSKQVNCFACPAGKFQNVSGQTYCIDCPYNTYNDTEGATMCSGCPKTPLDETTYTLDEGAWTSSLCRLFDRSGCREPRNLGVYPVYAAGSNEFGQTIEDSVVDSADGDPTLRQVIIGCDLLNGAEVVNSAGGGGHTILQTAMMTGIENSPRGRITTTKALWSLGRNNMGQLGATTTSQTSRVPILLPRFLFPSVSYGNLVSASVGNNVFTYWAWNSTARIRMKYQITIDEGYYGPADIMRKVAQVSAAEYGHPTGAFKLEVEPDTQALRLSVVHPGFQLDFTSGTLYHKFGVSQVLIPPGGTLREVSAASQNQIFKYRLWCESWPACTASTTVSIVLPDGIRSLLDVASEVNDQIFKNGHGQGPILQFDTANDKVVMTIAPSNPEARMQIIMGENNNMASFLGFEPGNYPPWGPINTTDAVMSFSATEARPWLNPFRFVDSARLYQPYQYDGVALGQFAKSFELGLDYTLVQTWDASETVSRLWSFGSNLYGQLGVQTNAGTNTPNPVPMLVTGFDEVNGGKQAFQFQASKSHTMVQASDKSLWAFGSNLFGQLGVNTNFETENANWNPIRVDVANFNDGFPSESRDPDKVDSFSLGFAHTLIRTVSNYSGDVKLWSFGSNHYGQLGTQLNSDVCRNPFSALPATVSCFQLAEDEVAIIVPVGTWEAQIVEQRLIDQSMMPTLTYSAAVAGANHSLVQASDGRMWCFGSNGAGECGNEYLAFDDLVYPAPTPILVGTKVLPRFGTLVSPSYECCALWDPDRGTGCTAPYGFWPYYGDVEPCPFMGRKVQIYSAGDRHSLLRSDDGKFWSFGENSQGQLVRTINLGNVNANPYVEEIPRTNFGLGNQPLLGFEVGDDHSLVQTHRPYCRFGNHSIDKREPCFPCEPGSFTDERGTLTSFNFSFDQSVQHPYVTLYNVTYLSPPTIISCTACAAGNFSDLAGSSVCGTCPAGTYAFQGASTCHQCEPGSVSGAMAGNCTLCAPGQSSVDPFTDCFNCPIGSFSGSSGSRECTLCAAGTYSDAPGSSTCTVCPLDFYQNATGATVCVLCPNDEKTSSTGAADIEECTNLCPPGSFGVPLNTGGLGVEPCSPCAVGTAAPERGQANECPACPAGNFSAVTGNSLCDPCPAGTFSLDGATVCSDCTAGTFSLSGSSACDECAAGTYSLDRAGSCTLCERGKYNDLPVQSSCDQCVDGTFTMLGETVCRDCVPGEEGQGGFCFNCAPGFFSATNRSLDCDPCAAGTFSGLRASVCTNCTPGYFNGELNATVCSPCVPGTFTDEFRTEVCDLCDPGSSSGFNATFCTICEPGLFAPTAGSPLCSECLAGTFSLANASVCTNCSAGTITDEPARWNCTGCEPGYYAFRDGLSTCTACACGTYGNFTGMSICWDCLAGTVSQSNATACEQCIPGTFAETPRMCECQECLIGSYAEGFGTDECTQCPQGKTTRGNGAGLLGRPEVVPEFFNEADDCEAPCQAGYYSSWGIEPCLPCPGGYFNQQNFSYLCFPCSAGYSSSDGSTTCTICPPGSFATAAQGSCTPCPQGSFQPSEGQSFCDLCAVGTYQDQTGRTDCETCPFRLAEDTYDILYYRDCRANCLAEILAGNFSNTTGSVNSSAFASTDCCNVAPVRSIEFPQGSNITSGEYSAAEIETLINDLVFEDIGINQFVKIDIDELGWSYGDFDKKKWLLHLQYGGFQILFSSEAPRFCSDGSCIVGPGSVDPMSGKFRRQVGTVLGFVPDKVKSFEEPTAFPAGGPTTCYFNELPTVDGGCYSRFREYSNADPVPLVTETTGTRSRFQCEAYCIAGTFNPDGRDTQQDPCDDCNSGFYSDAEGATACLPCSPGSYTRTSGSFTRCDPCEYGKFQNEPNATTCIYCPVGSFAPTQGQSTCDLCPPGTFSVTNTTASPVVQSLAPDTCVECSRGFYAELSGGTSCDACESGTYSRSSAASSCLFCEPGRFSNATAATSCSICTAGYRSSDPYGSASCLPCAAGTYSLAESSTCIDCQPGEYSDAMSSTCTVCPVGYFSSAAGSPNCTACDPGTIADSEGQVICDDCPRGQYQDQSNATLCFECPAGTFSQNPGSAVCALCGWGQYSQNGSFVCDRCPTFPQFTNTTGLLKTSVLDCFAYCEPGSAGYNGVEPCIPCYPGTTSLGTANPEPFSGFCNVDYVHTFAFEGGGIQATVIVNGSCVESGLGPCDPCPPGQENPYFGRTGCTECPASSYAVGGNANCTACPVNTVSEPGSTREDDCQRFCLRGSFSLTTLQPCTPCAAGSFTNLIGQTVCQLCAQGKYQDQAVQSTCLDCPAGMGTAGIGSDSLSNCTGVDEKFLESGFCNADDVYFRAQGHLSEVEVMARGSGYVPGVLDILGGPGEGFFATFQTIGAASRVANITVYEEGIGYTSSGRVELFYARSESVAQAEEIRAQTAMQPQYQGPPGMVPAVPDFDYLWVRTPVPMSNSITVMEREAFTDLQTTPASFLFGCRRGTIEVESTGGGAGFEATYNSSGTNLDICIGRMLNGVCLPGEAQHGAGYTSRPRVRVVEHTVVSVRVNPNSRTQGCQDTSLAFFTADPRAGGLVGSITATGGMIDSVTLVDGGSGFMEPPSVFPTDSNCTCGTGIGRLSLRAAGVGYPAFTNGKLVAEGGMGTGFEGTFSTDLSGAISSLVVTRPGSGYSPTTVVRACPEPSVWDPALACCRYDFAVLLPEFALASLAVDPGTLCLGPLTFVDLMVHLGLPGTVPGAFDECLEAVVDASTCRCGSEASNLTLLTGGAGYVAGKVLIVSGPDLCSVACAVDSASAFCLASGLPACTLSNFPLDATFAVAGTGANGTLEGEITSLDVRSGGGGYDQSSRVFFAYSGTTRCDDGTGVQTDACIQDGTISKVTVSGTITIPVSVGGFPVVRVGEAATICAPGATCSGSGFAGTCDLSAQNQISGITILNHGTGFDVAQTPNITCSFAVNRTDNISQSYVVNDVLSGTNMSLFVATVAGGGTGSLVVGKPSGVWGNHDECLDMQWADGNAFLVAGPLNEVEVRLLGEIGSNESKHYGRLSFNEDTLMDDRLVWFLQTAIGHDEFYLVDSSCVVSEEVRPAFPGSGFWVHRSLECTGTGQCRGYACTDDSDIWGLKGNLSVVIVEMSNSSRVKMPDVATQLHMAVFQIATGVEESWHPFRYSGIPLFDGATEESWIQSLAFGTQGGGLPFDALVQASTTQFVHRHCSMCLQAPASFLRFAPFNSEDSNATLSLRRGLAFNVENTHVAIGADGRRRLLGLERIYKQIRDGTVKLNLDGYLDIPGCYWPNTENIKWQIGFESEIIFHPFPSIVLFDRVSVSLGGIRQYEDIAHNFRAMLYLAENRPFEINASMVSLRADQGSDTAPLHGYANSTLWTRPFGARWLEFGNVQFRFEAHQYEGIEGVNVTMFTFETNGTARLLDDPWTVGGPGEVVAVSVKGNSAKEFPQIYCEIQMDITTADPAAVIRTFVQEAMNLNYSNPVCGTTAGRDLAFKDNSLRFIYSTWETSQYQIPSQDVRTYNCITRNGTAFSGSPCHFPFEYNGQIFTECTTQDWNAPWCATAPTYDGNWGECVCDKLRRGLYFTGDVRLSQDGPLNLGDIDNPERLERINNILVPLMTDGQDITDLHGTLEVFFPWFDSSFSNDLELLVLFAPSSLETCEGVNRTIPKAEVSTAPSGECERLGFVTEWLGEPGDTSMVRCRPYRDQADSLLEAATQAMLVPRSTVPPRFQSISSPVELMQGCIEAGLVRELSLCAAEKFRYIPVADPALFGRQFCFWTETSDTPGFQENKFATCSSCSGRSCTTENTPVLAWQLQDRVCLAHPC